MKNSMPNGFTYMTDEEKQLLQKVKEKPEKAQDLTTDILTLSRCPSEEFLLTAVFLCPMIIRHVHNQSFWLRMIAVTLDKSKAQYVNGMTPEIRAAADPKNKFTIMDLNMPHYLNEIYANACNLRVCGVTTLNKDLLR